MSNPLELFKLLLVTAVLEDGTVVAGRIGEDELEVVAAEGPSAHRASDALAGIAEAMNHDELFTDIDELRDEIVEVLPWQSDDEGLTLEQIAHRMNLRSGQERGLERHLAAMIRGKRVAQTDGHRYYIPEED